MHRPKLYCPSPCTTDRPSSLILFPPFRNVPLVFLGRFSVVVIHLFEGIDFAKKAATLGVTYDGNFFPPSCSLSSLGRKQVRSFMAAAGRTFPFLL